MHGSVSNHYYHCRHDSKTNNVVPKGKNLETKGGEDRRSRDLDVQAVPPVYERKLPDFVDHQTLESIVKYRQLVIISILWRKRLLLEMVIILPSAATAPTSA